MGGGRRAARLPILSVSPCRPTPRPCAPGSGKQRRIVRSFGSCGLVRSLARARRRDYTAVARYGDEIVHGKTAAIVSILTLMLVSASVLVAQATADTTPPTFASMSVSPSLVSAGAMVTVDVRITDAGTGVSLESSYPYVYYNNAGGSFGGAVTNMTRVSGTPQDGVYRGTMAIPAFAATGRWKVSQLGAKDTANNTRFVFPPDAPTGNGDFDVVSAGTLPTCSPRPNVRVTSAKTASGQMRSSIVATTNPPGALNTLREIRFGQIRNATVQLDGVGAVQSDQRVTLSAGLTSIGLTVTRVTGGLDVFVPFTVTDACGAWPSFVGAGPGAL